MNVFRWQFDITDYILHIRYPAKEYHSLGVFHLTESRGLDKFQVKREHSFFVKYVKVELLSHYGEEHFCPLTMFRYWKSHILTYKHAKGIISIGMIHENTRCWWDFIETWKNCQNEFVIEYLQTNNNNDKL